MQNDINNGLHIDEIVILLLFFADDMTIVGKTHSEIQKYSEKLYSYCKLQKEVCQRWSIIQIALYNAIKIQMWKYRILFSWETKHMKSETWNI